MPSYDTRVDAYIANAAPFAQPVMVHLRELIHELCPDVEETQKWGVPSFEYKGMFCGFAAFKKHFTFRFWKTPLVNDPHRVLTEDQTPEGTLARVTSLEDLPSDKIIKALILDAMRLNDEGIKVPGPERQKGVVKNEIPEPEYVSKALEEAPEALAVWKKFAPSHRKEYLEWITEAKTEATRGKRLLQMIGQLKEGKQRHWKYQ